MKKYNLLKVITISIVFVFLLTLVIPGSYVNTYSNAIESNGISSTGVWGLFSNIGIAMQYFYGIAVYLVAVACFYGILGNSINNMAASISNAFKYKKRLFVTITCILYGLLAAVINDYLILILFVPFTYKVMKNIGCDNKKILSSTLVAALIGAMCNIYNESLFSLLSLKLETLLLFKIITLVLSLFVLIMLINNKRDQIVLEKVENIDINKVEEKTTEIEEENVVVNEIKEKDDVSSKKTGTKKTTNKSNTTKNSKSSKSSSSRKKVTK